jgi:hypothetical protein
VHVDADVELVQMPKWARTTLEDAGVLVIQLILGGIDLISRSIVLHSLPLDHFNPYIFSWFSLQIHSIMARLLEIPFGNMPCRRSMNLSSRNRLGIWFPFPLEGKFLGVDGSTGPRA